MKRLELTKIGLFNPGRLTDEEIELSFVTRIAFFQYIFKKIIAEKPNSIPQHHLVIGQRGMGKTSLLVRIAVELRKKPYKDNFIALTFPEEQYNIDRLSKFWLNCLDALADAMDRENQTKFTKILDAEIDGIAKSHHQENNAIYAIFEQWTKKINRRPVLLVDNLNLIFDKISKEEQHQLRAILMSNNAPIMLGASATTIDDTVDYGAAFYDAFSIQYLKKLTLDESIEVLQNLANITGKKGFDQIIYKNKARLGALYELTGGTPRTISMLFPLIQDGFSAEIQTDLDALLDVVTPLYKARFEELPAQLQVVLDAIALHWEPMTIEQLRNVTQLENAQLSPQLKRLVDVGWLQKLDAFEAKGSAYELSERFFNIWYLMRRSSRRQKRELYCLSKFIESMYGEEVEDMANLRLGYVNNSPNQIFFDLALADTLKDKRLRNKLKNKSYSELLEMSETDESILKNFTIPNDKIQKKINELIEKQFEFHSEKKWDESYKVAQQTLNLEPNNAIILNNYGVACMNIKKYLQAEEVYLKALKNNSKCRLAWHNLGNLYLHLKKYSDAEKAYLNANEIDDENIDTWNNLAYLYLHYLDNYKESEKGYLKIVNLNPNRVEAWNSLGNLYHNYLRKYPEAEYAYLKAIEIDNKYDYPKYNLVFLYRDKLNKLKEAKELFESIPDNEELRDSHFLNKALFAYYEKNAGIAKGFIIEALDEIDNSLPLNTQDDWWKAAATIVKLGYGTHFLQTLAENGYDVILRPYYVAIQALIRKNPDLFFNSIAAEVREPAKRILEMMKKYNQ
jgi:tetratricopeptide (TPR) repeat protein